MVGNSLIGMERRLLEPLARVIRAFGALGKLCTRMSVVKKKKLVKKNKEKLL